MKHRIVTNAPSAYDYGYTDEVGWCDYELYPGRVIEGCRVVEVTGELHTAEYQRDRYLSGMYLALLNGERF